VTQKIYDKGKVMLSEELNIVKLVQTVKKLKATV